MNAYQFAHHDRVPKTPPCTATTELLDKAFSDEPLSREEKNRIVQLLYGIGASHGSGYRLLGWCWPMSQAKQMKRILVAFTNQPDSFRTYYAPDKTSLRKALEELDTVAEMIYAPTEQSAGQESQTHLRLS